MVLIGVFELLLLYAICCVAKWRILRHYDRPFRPILPVDVAEAWEYMCFSPHWVAWRVLLILLVSLGFGLIIWGLIF